MRDAKYTKTAAGTAREVLINSGRYMYIWRHTDLLEEERVMDSCSPRCGIKMFPVSPAQSSGKILSKYLTLVGFGMKRGKFTVA